MAAAALVLRALRSFGIQAHGHLSWLHFLSVVTLVNIPTAICCTRRGSIAARRLAMLSHAGGLVVAGPFAPGRYVYGVFFG